MFSNHYSAVKVQFRRNCIPSEAREPLLRFGRHPERSEGSQFEMLYCDHDACLTTLLRHPSGDYGGFASIILPLRGIPF
jgi:hypothetical protein